MHRGGHHSSGESIGDDMLDYMENVMQSTLDSDDDAASAEASRVQWPYRFQRSQMNICTSIVQGCGHMVCATRFILDGHCAAHIFSRLEFLVSEDPFNIHQTFKRSC